MLLISYLKNKEMYFVFYWIKLFFKIDKMIFMYGNVFFWVFSFRLVVGL